MHLWGGPCRQTGILGPVYVGIDALELTLHESWRFPQSQHPGFLESGVKPGICIRSLCVHGGSVVVRWVEYFPSGTFSRASAAAKQVFKTFSYLDGMWKEREKEYSANLKSHYDTRTYREKETEWEIYTYIYIYIYTFQNNRESAGGAPGKSTTLFW